MKLLFDQNLSSRLVIELESIFPDSTHVRLLGLESEADEEIWRLAKKNNYIIVTQDSDFNERSVIYGFPPKVIWLRYGNKSTNYLKTMIENHSKWVVK